MPARDVPLREASQGAGRAADGDRPVQLRRPGSHAVCQAVQFQGRPERHPEPGDRDQPLERPRDREPPRRHRPALQPDENLFESPHGNHPIALPLGIHARQHQPRVRLRSGDDQAAQVLLLVGEPPEPLLAPRESGVCEFWGARHRASVWPVPSRGLLCPSPARHCQDLALRRHGGSWKRLHGERAHAFFEGGVCGY